MGASRYDVINDHSPILTQALTRIVLTTYGRSTRGGLERYGVSLAAVALARCPEKALDMPG